MTLVSGDMTSGEMTFGRLDSLSPEFFPRLFFVIPFNLLNLFYRIDIYIIASLGFMLLFET